MAESLDQINCQQFRLHFFFPAGLLLAPLFAGHLGEFCGRKGILVVNALCWGSIVVLWKGLKGQLAGLVK